MLNANRKLEIRVHDTSFGLWQDDPNDPTFRTEVYVPLLRFLRRRGWNVGRDAEYSRQYPSLANSRRRATKAELLAELDIFGRHIGVKCWSENWPLNNPNGQKHDFDKRSRMPYLTRIRFDLEVSKVVAWLRRRCDLTVVDCNVTNAPPSRFGRSAMEWIQHQWDKSGHADRTLRRTVCNRNVNGGSNGRSADGEQIEHAQLVWFVDDKGRWLRGRAYYDLNNAWYIVTGEYSVARTWTGQIYVHPPADLRVKHNGALRRKRLEQEMTAAALALKFTRAELLRRIIFGDSEPVLIYSRKWHTYYAERFCGYAGLGQAGKYSREEAEREVRRVPHILEIRSLQGETIFSLATAAEEGKVISA